jgi:flagellar basal-body rod modification protein FlgD
MIPESTLPTAYSSYASESETNADISSLGKNDFLKLLIAQLKNQDPLNPADNTEFIAQLAQFSALEQMTLMNGNLEKSLESNTNMTEVVSNAMLINYFGKYATVENDSFVYDGDGSIELKFEIDSAASYGTLEIIDTSGNIIKSVSLDALDSGAYYIEWDGITNKGIQAGPGVYTYSVELFDVAGNEIDVTQMFSGLVESVSYIDGIPQLNVGGVLVPFNNVISITDISENE